MKANEFVNEHSNWEVDPRYTSAVINRLFVACNAISNVMAKKGTKFTFTKHFFDQVKAKRGDGKMYTTDDLLTAMGKISNAGLARFKGKPPGSNFVFYDPRVDIFIAVVRDSVDSYVATTTVHDTQWYGDGQVIDL